MFSLIVENSKGEQLSLSQNSNYVITGISGLTPPSSTINLSSNYGTDGSRFNSSKVEKRNIVINVKPQKPVEANRINLYRYFKTKQYCKIYYSNDARSVYIEGYVEAIEGDLFEKTQVIQISIICPQPYFKGLAEIAIDISNVIAAFEFPFETDNVGVEVSVYDYYKVANVYNSGDVESGMIIHFTASGSVTNPIKIINTNNGEFLSIDHIMLEGEEITINTYDNEKSIYYKNSSGEISNLLSYLADGSKFLKCDYGLNQFTYTAGSGISNLKCEIIYRDLYEGV